ncbi:YhdP family protein [Azospirillum sp. ST 5-10]|uniref:YhdP family protein n=1 Tax=unclassified Azospirillum TaxID=2630922 RepID=UPI003F49E66A
MIRRTAKLAAWTAATVAVLAGLVGGGIAWRLSAGPIALDALTPYVERALADAVPGTRVAIGALGVSWVDDDGDGIGGLDLRAVDVAATNADGEVLAAVPELGVGFSVRALLRGRLEPTRLELVRPRIAVVRHGDGRFGFDIRAGERGADGTAADAGSPVVGEVLAALEAPPDADRPLGLLRRLSVAQADLRVTNEASGFSWHATRADIDLRRDRDGIDGRLALTLDLGGETASLTATADRRRADGRTVAAVRIDDLELARLARVAPELAPLAGAAFAVDGTLELDLDRTLQPQHLRFDLAGGPGVLAVPGRDGEALAVRSAGARGAVDLAARRLELEGAALLLGGPGDGPGTRLAAAGQLTADGGFAVAPTGSLTLTLAHGLRTSSVMLDAVRDGADGLQVTAEVEKLEPALLAALAPELEPLSAAALPVVGTATLRLDGSLRPRDGRLDLAAGPGRLVLPDRFAAPLEIRAAAIQAVVDAQARHLDVDRLAIDLGGPTFEARLAVGEDRTGGDRLRADGSVTARDVPLDDLARLWPTSLSKNAREWITENLSRGTVHEATAIFSGSAPLADPGAFERETLKATLTASDVDVEYFRPLPPVRGITAVRGEVDGTTFTIHTEGGRVEDVELGAGTVVIHDLGGKESIDIDVPVDGPVRTILTVLDSPPLGYPSRLDIDPAGTEGRARADLRFRFPLLVDLKVDDVDVGVTGKLSATGVKKVAAGLDASAGDLDLELDTKSMTVKGKARLDGVPVVLDWKEQFEDAAKGPRTRVHVKGTADAGEFAKFGVEAAEYASGPVGFDVVFTVDQRKRLGLTGTLDLAPTDLRIEDLAWTKKPGVPASGRFTLEFRKDKVVRVSGITFQGGGLKAAAALDLDPATTALTHAQIAELKLEETDLRADVVVRDGAYVATVTGASLDARRLLDDDGGGGDTAAPPRRRRPLVATLRVGRVIFGDGRQLGDVVAKINNDGSVWTLIDVTASTGPSSSLFVRFEPAGDRYKVQVIADDAGRALKMLDLNDRIEGGRLRITGTTREPRADAAIDGRIDMTDYTVVEAPTLARILNAISPSGFAELMQGKGITFGRLVGEFRKQGRLLTLKEVRTSGSALGLTLEGDVDLVADVANLQGTIVPVYGLNRILGQIPILGDVLSGGAGQGIFAATWHVRGPFADPDVSVNPLAVLAPGFLRNLFFLGSTGGAAAPADGGAGNGGAGNETGAPAAADAPGG